jgi:hypothetical protein
MAIFFTVLSAMNFLSMREIGIRVHTSVKSFYFGGVSIIISLIFILFYEP